MSFTQSVFYRLGRPRKKAIPVDAIGRTSTTIIPAKVDDKIINTGDTTSGTAGPVTTTTSTTENIIDKPLVDLPEYDGGGENLDELYILNRDTPLHSKIRAKYPDARFIRIPNGFTKTKLDNPFILLDQITDNTIRYYHVEHTDRPSAQEVTDPARFKGVVDQHNDDVIENGYATTKIGKSLPGFLDKLPK